MTDLNLEAQFTSNLEGALEAQMDSENLEERLQRVEEIAQKRAEWAAERAASRNQAPEPEPETRLSIRERIVQQTQSQRPSSQRRHRQHPRRSASFHTGDTNVQIANEIQNFREVFESARSNIFGSRSPGSSENLTGFPVPRRALELPSSHEGSLPNSGSSTPRLQRRGANELTQNLDDPFASVLVDLGLGFGSNSNISDSGRQNGSRSISATREGRSNTTTNLQRFLMSNAADTTRSTRNGRNERRSRMTERRRQTIGVTTSDVREALALTSSGSHESHNHVNTLEARPSDSDNISLTRDSFQYSSFRARYQRKIEINETATRPILALTEETVVYIDDKGHCHWLEKNHPLLKATKETSMPPVVVRYKADSAVPNQDATDSVTDIPGNPEERYGKIRELIKQSKNREGSCGNNDFEDYNNSRNDLISEFESNGVDNVDAKMKSRKNMGVNPSYTIQAIEERFKHVSHYTKPRPRPDINNYKLMRKYKSIYDYEGDEQSGDVDERSNEITQQLSAQVNSTESPRVNGLHISVTDRANRVDNLSVVDTGGRANTPFGESAEVVSALRRETRQINSVDRPYVQLGSDISARSDYGHRAQSAFLHRSVSVQESRPARLGLGESSTSTLVRHGSLESTFSRNSGQSQYGQTHRHSDIHEEVESIINRLQQRHAYAEIPIDTSHLDIEEMRMIQKALEENPSPPPSPVDFEVPEITYNTMTDQTTENALASNESANVILEPVANDKDKTSTNELGPLSPVQEDTAEIDAVSNDTDQPDSVNTVFDEFVSTVNEEHTLSLPRGHIFSNK